MNRYKAKKTDFSSFFRLLFYLKQYRALIIGGLVTLISASLLKLLVPYVIQFTIDRAVIVKNMNNVILGGGAVVILAVLIGLCSYISNILNSKFSSGLAYDLRNHLYKHIQHMSFSFHDRIHTGQLLTRMTSDVDLIRTFVQGSGYQIVMTILTFAGSVVLLFYTNWYIALLMVPFIIFSLTVFQIFSRKTQPRFKKAQEALAVLNTRLKENIWGIKLVKAFHREDYEIEVFNRNNLIHKNINMKTSIMFAINIPLILMISNLSRVVTLWTGGFLVADGSFTIGQLIAFNSYLTTCLFQIDSMTSMRMDFSRAKVGAERIFQILDTESEVKNKENSVEMPHIKGNVVFNNVSFHYYESGNDILKSVSFETKPGQTVAIIGETGSGKSTIVNLIPRFYDVTGGSISIDGFDIRDVTLESLRRQIGIVLQEPILFKRSIRENIAYGRPQSTEEEIIEAAKTAEAHDFITELPEGYDTVIAEKGVTLSGGQKQRIAIARTLLINPAILILDDSTSSVDTHTEQKIYNAMEKLKTGKLCFVIAQRMSTVLKSDLVLVIQKGRIAAMGNHEELLEGCPLYADIYYSQLQNDLRLKV